MGEAAPPSAVVSAPGVVTSWEVGGRQQLGGKIRIMYDFPAAQPRKALTPYQDYGPVKTPQQGIIGEPQPSTNNLTVG